MWEVVGMRIVGGGGQQLTKRLHQVVILAPALAAMWAITRDLNDVIRDRPYEPWVVAEQLRTMGISPGTEVGYIGTGLYAYWAHLPSVRVHVGIPDQQPPRLPAAG